MENIYAAFCRRPFRTLFVLASLAATPLAAAPCPDVTPVPLGSDLLVYEIPAGDFSLFEVDVHAAGVLAVEASTPVNAEVEPRLALFGDDCRPATPAGVRVLARWISAMVVEVDAPGTYRFAVAAQDPGAPLPEVTFTTRFVDASELDPYVAKEAGEPEPDPDMFRADRDALCPPAGDDRHGGVFACAAPIVPGKPATGQLGGDDVDVFTFTVATQRTVTIKTKGDATAKGDATTKGDAATKGDATIVGSLHDSSGHRLAVDGDGEGLRLVRTLAPGRYYARVSGAGAYVLTVKAASW
jgi:hypothetical protein